MGDRELRGRVPRRVSMDASKMEAGVRLFLEGIGERFPGDDLENTPARVAPTAR